MSYTVSGSHAEAVFVYRLTAEEAAAAYPGIALPDDPSQKVVALVDHGNGLVYVIEGDANVLANRLIDAIDGTA